MPRITPLFQAAIVGAALLCAPGHANFFSSCQKAIRAFLPWVGISPEGLQFHWIQRELTHDLLFTLENNAHSVMATGLEPSDAFYFARRLSRRWQEEYPQEPGAAIFAARRLHEWVVPIVPHTYDCLRQRCGCAQDLTAGLRQEFTPRVADHFRRGPGSPEYATGRAENLLARHFKVRRTFYTTLDHVPIAAAVEFRPQDMSNWFDGYSHHLLLTPPDNIDAILTDVSRRLEMARDLPPTDENLDERMRLFTAAVYGYYQAFPFERGTHDLGRALFKGFFSALFGHDLGHWPNEDRVLDFLVVSQHRFVELMMPFFKGSLPNGSHP